mmetsp:Transcript_33074/g.78345  ORF Transcript_33074/g.78345 Transcript_33074/m.78345 type:complete len:256 (-) Transcript_33074:244-1011(-)
MLLIGRPSLEVLNVYESGKITRAFPVDDEICDASVNAIVMSLLDPAVVSEGVTAAPARIAGASMIAGTARSTSISVPSARDVARRNGAVTPGTAAFWTLSRKNCTMVCEATIEPPPRRVTTTVSLTTSTDAFPSIPNEAAKLSGSIVSSPRSIARRHPVRLKPAGKPMITRPSTGIGLNVLKRTATPVMADAAIERGFTLAVWRPFGTRSTDVTFPESSTMRPRVSRVRIWNIPPDPEDCRTRIDETFTEITCPE